MHFIFIFIWTFIYRYKLLTNSGNKCCKGRRPWIYYDAIDSIVTSDPNVNENQIKDSLTLGMRTLFLFLINAFNVIIRCIIDFYFVVCTDELCRSVAFKDSLTVPIQ